MTTRLWKILAVLSLFVAILPVAGIARSAPLECPSVSPKPLGFAKPRFIDKRRAGGEPVSIVAQDGSLVVSAHAGTTHLYKDP
ncbi:MAG: hypothetical protein ACLGHL_08640, partial [Actinomycetota bacterium]